MSRTVANWTENRPFRYISQHFDTHQPDLGSGAARRGGSSPSSCTEWESNEIPEEDAAAAREGAADADTCADTSTRARLVAALTEALQRLIAEGDGEGAQVVLRTLHEAAQLACRPTSGAREQEATSGATVTRLESTHKRRRGGSRD